MPCMRMFGALALDALSTAAAVLDGARADGMHMHAGAGSQTHSAGLAGLHSWDAVREGQQAASTTSSGPLRARQPPRVLASVPSWMAGTCA